MGVFKVPRATTAQRMTIVLDAAEIVFDTDLFTYFGGDGETLGGFPIGAGVSTKLTETFVLTQTDIDNNFVTLSKEAVDPETTVFILEGGPQQIYLNDYEIDGQQLTFTGLVGFLEAGDKIIITYESSDSLGAIETREKFVLTQNQINNKQIVLQSSPSNPTLVKLLPEGGISQIYGVDFTVNDNILSWSNLGLDNFLESGEILFVTY